MGAQQFEHSARGKNAEEAFQLAREEALYDHGHSGYSGSIAEKQSFKEFPVPEGEGINFHQWVAWIERASCGDLPEGYERFHNILEKAGKVYDDKWGSAVCVQEDDHTFLFMGYASS